MPKVLTDLFGSEKGIIALGLIIGSVVLVALGRMSVDQWTSYTQVIFASYAVTKTATTVGAAIANRPAKLPDAGSAAAVTNIVTTPTSDPTASPNSNPGPTPTA